MQFPEFSSASAVFLYSSPSLPSLSKTGSICTLQNEVHVLLGALMSRKWPSVGRPDALQTLTWLLGAGASVEAVDPAGLS